MVFGLSGSFMLPLKGGERREEGGGGESKSIEGMPSIC